MRMVDDRAAPARTSRKTSMAEDTRPSHSPRPGPPRRGPLGAWDRLPANVRGALFAMLGGCLLILMASVVKHLGQQLPVFEVLFVRFCAGLLILIPVLWRNGFRIVRTGRPVLHLARGFVGFMGNICFFFALAHMVLADAVTIQFSRPIFMLFVAALFLGELAGARRIAVAMIGFGGILMITRPFGAGFEPWALAAAGGAFFGTLVIVCVKLLSRTEHTLTIMFYFSVWTTVLAAIPAFYVWVTPTWTQLGLLVLTGALGIIGQGFFTHGVTLGDTTFVMPFDYLRIVYSVIFGVIWFGEFPAPWSLAGAAVIIGSSLYLLRAEQKDKAAARAAARDEGETR
jgi:drug/metabolite transporter (DMT)-like permease